MSNLNKIYFNILLLILFGLFNSIKMETVSDDSCDANDAALAQWYGQVYNFVTTNQNITQQTLNMQAKLIQLESSIEEIQNKMEVNLKNQLVQQEHRMKEMYNQLEANLKIQFLEQEHRIQETQHKLEANLKIQQSLSKKLEEVQQKNNADIVIQRRMDGSVDFQRTWHEYQEGFGNSSGEFFIGLEMLHKLTNSRPYELLIVMEDWENDRRYAKYDQFIVGSEAENYVLKSLGTYSGSAGDSMTYELGQRFTTKDRDNDVDGRNCAVVYTGAWWFKACHQSHLNGRYLKGKITEYAQGIAWYPFKGHYYSLKFVEMLIRPN